MKLCILILTAAVCAEEAAVAAPAPCNCKPEVNSCVTKCENTIKMRDSQATMKCTESLTTANAQAKKLSDGLEKQIADLNAQLKQAQSRIKSLESDSSSELTTLKSSMSSQKSMYEKQVEAIKKEIEVEKGKTSALKVQKEKSESQVKQLKDIINQLEPQIAALQLDINDYKGVIFSQKHLEVMAGNLETIGRALVLNFKDNVNRIFNGVDVFELLRLQSLVVYSKMEPHVKQAELAFTNFSKRIDLQDRIRLLEKNASPYLSSAKTLVEHKMERMVGLLSRTNPQIRKMFPVTFVDRLIAFSYLGIVIYIACNIVGSILLILVAPFQALRPHKRVVADTAPKKVSAKTPNATTTRTSKISARNSAAETDVTTTPR